MRNVGGVANGNGAGNLRGHTLRGCIAGGSVFCRSGRGTARRGIRQGVLRHILPSRCGTCLRATLLPAMDIDNEPVRIGQQKRRVLRHVIHIQHDARAVAGVLRGADAFQKAIIHYFKALADQFRRQPGAMQIEEDAIRARHTRCLVLHGIAQVNGDARVRGRGPVANARHQRHAAARMSRPFRRV